MYKYNEIQNQLKEFLFSNYIFFIKYRITAALKVETYIIISIAVSLIGRTAIMYFANSKTYVIVFTPNVIWYLMSCCPVDFQYHNHCETKEKNVQFTDNHTYNIYKTKLLSNMSTK